MGISFAGFADHLSGKLLFSAALSGDQEVPPIETDASGVGTFFLNDAKDSLCVSLTVTGLSGPVTGAHIHTGAVGENGPVLINFDGNISGNRIQAVVTGDDLTPESLKMMLDGELYFNIHTEMHPAGEIRGQIILESDTAFRAVLDTDQENHEVMMSEATGLATFNVSMTGMVHFFGAFDMLSGPVTMVHLHQAAAGEDGPVVLDLEPFLSGNTVAGSFDPATVDGLQEAMMAGEIYINVHTALNPAGEIRGQLTAEKRLSFDATLNTEQEIPAPEGSDGNGAAFVSLNHTMDTLFYDVQVSMLSGPITMAHFHEGAAGETGDVVIDMGSGIDGNRISGFAAGQALSTELINNFLSGEIYINVHTELNMPGEIRGQVLPLVREGYTFNLDGMQEVPAVDTDGTGSGFASIDRDQSNVHFAYAYNQLSGPATMAHFHMAAMGENGPVIFDFEAFSEENNASGTAAGIWAEADAMPFDANAAAAFRSGTVYVNIHTSEHPGGEIRGQVLRDSECSLATLSADDAPVRRDFAKVYPNPASDVVFISVNDAPAGTYTLRIHDMAGRMVKQQLVMHSSESLTELPVSALPQGLYMLSVTGEDLTFTGKFIKQ